MRRRLIIPLLGIVFIGAGIWTWINVPFPQVQTAVSSPLSVGGPFTLVDHSGKTVTDADFRGRHLLIFFGYTFCPDVCPTLLQTVSEAMDLLGKEAERVQPLFVTLDPERDSPEVLADYVGNFHPRFVGLTGTRDQIDVAAKAYRVSYMKFFPPPGSLLGDSDPEKDEEERDDNYFVNHSAVVFLIGSDGKYLTHFSHQTAPDVIATRIREYL